MAAIDSHPILAREGWFYVSLSVLAAVLTAVVFPFITALLFWIIAIFVVQFFRDPHRQINDDPNIVVSPADGKVIFTGLVKDPYLDRQAYKVSVFMNVFSVHSNRAPLKARVKQIWYQPGSFVNAALDKASSDNEHNAVLFVDQQDRQVLAIQIAGLVARRILCYVKPEQAVDRGQRYGFIRFGSRLDVYLPTDFIPAVSMGDKMTAGVSSLGRFDVGN